MATLYLSVTNHSERAQASGRRELFELHDNHAHPALAHVRLVVLEAGLAPDNLSRLALVNFSVTIGELFLDSRPFEEEDYRRQCVSVHSDSLTGRADTLDHFDPIIRQESFPQRRPLLLRQSGRRGNGDNQNAEGDERPQRDSQLHFYCSCLAGMARAGKLLEIAWRSRASTARPRGMPPAGAESSLFPLRRARANCRMRPNDRVRGRAFRFRSEAGWRTSPSSPSGAQGAGRRR